MQLALDSVLICLLAATLFYALRLERALGVLKQDRGALEQLVATFDAATHQAEQGVERLRASAESSGQLLSRQVDRAAGLRDDLAFLAERAERAADRMEQGLRAARPAPSAEDRLIRLSAPPDPPAESPPRPQRLAPPPAAEPPDDPALSGLRSQAERDLLKALRLSRASADIGGEAVR
jgi:hypothetical protein